MFCPNCRYEYKPGVTRCPDCNELLVAELPPEEKLVPEYIELVTVFESSNHSKILIAKSILDESGIDYHPGSDALVDLFGGGRLGFNPVTGAVKFQVRPDDADTARELLADLANEPEEFVGDPDQDS